MNLGPLTHVIIAAAIKRLEEVLGLMRDLLADGLENSGCATKASLAREYLTRSLREIQAEGYKTNDLIIVPYSTEPMADRRVMINGHFLKLTTREALLLLILIDHNQRLGHRRRDGFEGSILFCAEDVRKPMALAQKLGFGSDPVSRYVRTRLSSQTRRLLTDRVEDETDSPELAAALIQDLNQLIKGPSLIGQAAFGELRLSKETKRLLRRDPAAGAWLVLMNRLLLQDAYPEDLVKLPSSFLSVEAILDELILLNGEEGLEGAWQYPTSNDVYKVVDSLRDTLNKADLNEHLVEGERGAGYRLSTAPWNVWFHETSLRILEGG